MRLLNFQSIKQESPMSIAYLEITLNIQPENRSNAGAVYSKYKQPFLETITGAVSKQLLVREEDVQVLHCFDTVANATKYLESSLFNEDVVSALSPLLASAPEVRVYDAM